MFDSYRHKGLRAQLIQEIKRKGINDEKVLNAISRVPRHLFLDKAFEEWAYKDQAFAIDCEQTISQPYTVAYQTTLLEIKPKDKVLEISSGLFPSQPVKRFCKAGEKNLSHKTSAT